MGLRAVALRVRIDMRRPASWLAGATSAALAAWLVAQPGVWWPVAAVLAGALGAAAAIGTSPARDGAPAWLGLRAAWPAAGALLGWIASGGDLRSCGPPATMLVACGATAAAIARAAGAGLAPADATETALAAAAVAATGAVLGPAWPFAAACGWVAALACAPLLRRAAMAAAPRLPRGAGGVAVPRAVMASALLAMVVCLFLAPHVANAYAALAGAWLLVSAAPRAALGPGAAGDRRRRVLVATMGGTLHTARAAARLVAGYAAVLVWPPLVAAAVAGSVGAAAGPLAIAAVIGAGAAGLAMVAAGALAIGGSRDTTLALVLCASVAACAGGAALVSPARAPPDRPDGLMLSNPGDPARLSGPRDESRPCTSHRGVASCPAPPASATASRFVPWRRFSPC